ncbi:MAG TPA: HlyC/CorC family transporter [bacterium]|nr:HlyC/CorC family transporter [bacterium]
MIEVLLLITAFALSAFFSGTETAFVSARRITLEIWKRQGSRAAQRTLHFLGKPHQYLSTTLVGNNIAVVLVSSLMAVILHPYFSGFYITLITSSALLLFGEILPKELARHRPTRYSVKVTLFLRFFYFLFYPVAWSVMNLASLILKLFGLSQETVRHFFTREDLDILVSEGEKSGLVNRDERSMISRFLLRGGYKVRDVMVPRTEMAVVRKKDSVKTAVRKLIKTGFSRLPVIEGSIDHIAGLIYAMDLINLKPKTLSPIIRETLFVPESLIIGKCLRTMQSHGATMAVVVDEHGGTAGLVTIEDIIEEFFGEIHDEFDSEKKWYRKTGPATIEVNAMVELNRLNETFHLDLKPGDYQTLGGFLIHQAGRIPRRNEIIAFGHVQFRILSCTRRRIQRVRIELEKSRLEGKSA